MRPRAKALKPRRSDRRYGSWRWRLASDRVLGRSRWGKSTREVSPPTALCALAPDDPPHLADVADHVIPVYPGMPDSEFFGEWNLQPACQAHNKAKGFNQAQARRSAVAAHDATARPSIFRRRR